MYVDDELILHMLGYLQAKHFVDAIRWHDFEKDDVLKLASKIDERYETNLRGDIILILEEYGDV